MTKTETEIDVAIPRSKPVVNTAVAQLRDLANRVARSSVAVVDAVAQRGGFKGEEFSTIGALRDQCVQMIQIVESMEQEQAMSVDD